MVTNRDRSIAITGSLEAAAGAGSRRVARERQRMDQVPYDLDDNRREIVLKALQERCRERGWNLLAATCALPTFT
jgi:hypothetical protein